MAQPAHYTFECYCPEYYTEDGIAMMHNVRVQTQHSNMTVEMLVESFENFLRSSGYNQRLNGYRIKVVGDGKNE